MPSDPARHTTRKARGNDFWSVAAAFICLGIGCIGAAGFWGVFLLVGLSGMFGCAIKRIEEVIAEERANAE